MKTTTLTSSNSKKYILEFHQDTNDAYNVAFTLIELSATIQTTKPAAAVGPDELHISIIKKTPTQFLHILLSLLIKYGTVVYYHIHGIV